MEGSFGVRKGAWTEEEDILLKQCIQKYGEGKWHLVPVRAGIILESRVSQIDFSFFFGKPSFFCLCLFCLFFQFVRKSVNATFVIILMWFVVVVYVKMIEAATHNMLYQSCCENHDYKRSLLE